MPTCPSCGRENADDARFCSACGTALTTSTPMQEQRKVVTILFCDLVGSTALGESTDPEALRARMRRYFEDLRAILERHGGTVEKFVGDAVMAVFGIPTAHEDDALRAVRAARISSAASRARSSPATRSTWPPASSRLRLLATSCSARRRASSCATQSASRRSSRWC